MSITRHIIPVKRIVTKEVVIKATDVSGLAYGIADLPGSGIYFNSPYLSFDPDTVQGIGAEIKLPKDRALDTDIFFKFFYTIPTGPGGNNIVWRLDWLIRNKGNLLNVVPNTSIIVDKTLSPGLLMVTPAIVIPAHQVDIQQLSEDGEDVEFQLGIIRQADDVNDVETSSAYLFKVVMEYSGYEY